MRKIVSLLAICFIAVNLNGQNEKHEKQIETLYEHALNKGKAYDWLNHLSNKIGGRLSGSLNAERAVLWGREMN